MIFITIISIFVKCAGTKSTESYVYHFWQSEIFCTLLNAILVDDILWNLFRPPRPKTDHRVVKVAVG